MNRKTKIILAGAVIGFLWGTIQIPVSVLGAYGLMECNGRNFFDVIYDNIIRGVIASPIIVPLFIPTIISMAVSCNILLWDYGPNLIHFFMIVLPPIFGCFIGIVIGFVLVNLWGFNKK